MSSPATRQVTYESTTTDGSPEKRTPSHSRWSFGVLNDKTTIEVPGMYTRLHMLSIRTDVDQDATMLTLNTQVLCCFLPRTATNLSVYETFTRERRIRLSRLDSQ